MKMRTIYKATVLKTKQEDFLNFLRNLGVKREELKLAHNRGDFYLYDIDLSNRDENNYSSIRSELSKHILDFI